MYPIIRMINVVTQRYIVRGRVHHRPWQLRPDAFDFCHFIYETPYYVYRVVHSRLRDVPCVLFLTTDSERSYKGSERVKETAQKS